MKKTKLQKGITLIALIITIVVLLILAVVTIGTIQKSKIITHARDAASDYKIAQEKELIGIGYSEYLIEKSISKDARLRVEGAQVTPIENVGWEVVFSETNSKYQVDKSGTITYIEEGEDTGEGEVENEDDAESVIATEKDLTDVMYNYNTMYNQKQPQIVSVKGYYDDENNDRISDINSSLGAYIYWTYFDIEKNFFEQTISKPGDIQGNIAAKITHFDGTEEEITLVTTDNEKWVYESEGSSLMGIDTYIGFRPFAKSYDIWNKDKIDDYEESSEYHYMYIEEELVVPFYKLEMLGKTIEFPFNCQASIGCVNVETGELLYPMYNNIDDVSKIIVNFSDGSKKAYTQDNIFDASSFYGEYYYSSQDIPVLYENGVFAINMPESSLKNPITSVIVEENGVATKYNVTESTRVVHTRLGS